MARCYPTEGYPWDIADELASIVKRMAVGIVKELDGLSRESAGKWNAVKKVYNLIDFAQLISDSPSLGDGWESDSSILDDVDLDVWGSDHSESNDSESEDSEDDYFELDDPLSGDSGSDDSNAEEGL
ncbi:MAG: hypothetical protein Q9162_006796 [Coniocarpon cinnabarinum]